MDDFGTYRLLWRARDDASESGDTCCVLVELFVQLRGRLGLGL